jgi:hypothetical protein
VICSKNPFIIISGKAGAMNEYAAADRESYRICGDFGGQVPDKMLLTDAVSR